MGHLARMQTYFFTFLYVIFGNLSFWKKDFSPKQRVRVSVIAAKKTVEHLKTAFFVTISVFKGSFSQCLPMFLYGYSYALHAENQY